MDELKISWDDIACELIHMSVIRKVPTPYDTKYNIKCSLGSPIKSEILNSSNQWEQEAMRGILGTYYVMCTLFNVHNVHGGKGKIQGMHKG